MKKDRKIVLIGGYPNGFDIPFHPKTRSGMRLRKIVQGLNINPIYFDLWTNEKEENERILLKATKKSLDAFARENTKMIALGRYIEEFLIKNNYKCEYLPHPASRDKKFITQLEVGLARLK